MGEVFTDGSSDAGSIPATSMPLKALKSPENQLFLLALWVLIFRFGDCL
jgi:hypothetical protein